jgi:hypothetical protein
MPSLTARDFEILSVLAGHVRVLSIRQIAHTWWAGQKNADQNATNRFRQLENRNYVKLHPFTLHPVLTNLAPLFEWKPGSPAINASRVSWLAQKRWNEAPIRTTVVTATEVSRRMLGASPGRRAIRSREVLHDLHVAELFLERFYPQDVERWEHEDQLIANGWQHDILPDAVVDHADGPIAIDFIGAYSANKLATMHQAYERLGIACRYF